MASRESSFTYLTYNYVNGVLITLESQLDDERHSFWAGLGIGVFSVFLVEAHLNHIAACVLFPADPNWERDEDDGYISFEKKIALVLGKLGIPLDRGREPLQTVLETKRVHDSLAHGKTETIVAEHDYAKSGPTPTRWEEYVCRRTPARILERCREFVTLVHEKVWPGDYPFGRLGTGSLSVPGEYAVAPPTPSMGDAPPTPSPPPETAGPG